MIRFCYVCQKPYGEKEPLDDKSKSHGICEKCYPGEIKRFKKECEQAELDLEIETRITIVRLSKEGSEDEIQRLEKVLSELLEPD